MTLEGYIKRRIRQDGPTSVASYMADCLTHPEYGYYPTRDPLGVAGDFTTAPEISQMFGELLGLALAQTWIDQGRPSPFTLAELGPGRGTLMADMLRTAAAVPGFVEAAYVTLVELSPALRKRQAEALRGYSVEWIESPQDLPEAPLFLIANEFFDALPIRQFVRDGSRWRERQIGLNGDKLEIGLGPALPQPALNHRLQDTKDGDLVEDCPASAPVIDAIGSRINRHGGAALIIDYGDWRSQGDTWQAMRGHDHVDPLDAPGTADQTAHVDFEALTRAAPCAYTRLTAQGVFLERLGITVRAQSLADANDGARRDDVISAHRRLTHPDEMGNLFKVVGLYPAGSRPPPGLEP